MCIVIKEVLVDICIYKTYIRKKYINFYLKNQNLENYDVWVYLTYITLHFLFHCSVFKCRFLFLFLNFNMKEIFDLRFSMSFLILLDFIQRL